MYGLNWLLSAAQVELLAIDTCILVTNSKRKDGGGKDRGKKSKTFSSPSLSKIEEVTRRWKAKYEGHENEKIPFKDIF